MGFNYSNEEVMQMNMNSKERKLDEMERRLRVVEKKLETYIRENKRGEWVDDVAFYDEEGCPCIVTRCNQCGEPNPVSNFCPNCGADMRGEKQDE